MKFNRTKFVGTILGMVLGLSTFNALGFKLEAEAGVDYHSRAVAIPANQTPPVVSGQSINNVPAQAGKITWHNTFAKACAAAKQSGKPVLLFEMLGKLDEEFC